MAEDWTSYTEKESVKREGKNCSKYRRLYSDLLKEHQGVLQQAWQGATSDAASSSSSESDAESDDSEKTDNKYRKESNLIQEMWESERNAVGIGLACGLAFFAVVHHAPKLLIRLGGEKKILKLQLADEEAKKAGSYIYQRAFAWIIEGTFSFWIGNRVYQYQSNNSAGAYDTLVKIPLCSGRSIISDSVCPQWVDITARQIPRPFWKNLDENYYSTEAGVGGLPDEQAWRSILNFSNNCIKRGAHERKLKQDQKVSSDASTHILLSTDVPDDVVLTKEEANNLVEDGVL